MGGEGSTQTDLIILTHDAREGAMNAALTQLQALPSAGADRAHPQGRTELRLRALMPASHAKTRPPSSKCPLRGPSHGGACAVPRISGVLMRLSAMNKTLSS